MARAGEPTSKGGGVMGEVHGGHIAARHLREVAGVDAIFSLSGGHIMPIYGGCLEHDIRVISAGRGQAAAMMARAWSIYEVRTGVCPVTAGPGFANPLAGVADACMENAPMAVIAGMGAIREMDTGALQDMNQADMVKPVTKRTGRRHATGRMPACPEEAFRRAESGRPGPAYLELPMEILHAKVEEGDIAYPARSARREVAPDEAAVREAVELIDNAEKPVLWGGSGVGWSDAGARLRERVEKAGIPTLLPSNGRGAVPDDHPLSLWEGGVAGMTAALSMADVVLSVGIRFNWVLNHGDLVAGAKVIRVGIEPNEANRNRVADVPLWETPAPS